MDILPLVMIVRVAAPLVGGHSGGYVAPEQRLYPPGDLVIALLRDRFTQLEDRLDEEVQHPIFGYKTSYRRCLELQARLLARTVTGEPEAYPPLQIK